MFQALSQYLPLNKELKRKDFLENKFIPYDLFSPKYNPFLPCFCGWKNYYNIIIDYFLIEKLDDEIRYIREKKEEDMRRELLRYEDINKRLESLKKEYVESFMNAVELPFREVFTISVEKGNLEMIKTLVEKYGIHVACIRKIYVSEIGKEVMKYIKSKGIDKK